ncbi:zf-TFIIB domain-containing protein [Aerosakkonemataceae cyanobacterium BLCC-F154]|uniref:Zf-TFIIB domain-containing protein n=1 Tax=Floridaenema fluviatile BLCC-F154 TaxID=3153640 RepID=A0ABV4YDV3_9CYAN
MRCPACGNELSQKLAGNIIVDVCEGGCGGIWFDRFELDKVDNLEEVEGESLLNITKNSELEVNPNLRRYCPKCPSIPMMRHYYSIKRKVLIDKCPGCAGVWLDAGELAEIRSQFGSEKEKEIVTEEYIANIVSKYMGK